MRDEVPLSNGNISLHWNKRQWPSMVSGRELSYI